MGFSPRHYRAAVYFRLSPHVYPYQTCRTYQRAPSWKKRAMQHISGQLAKLAICDDIAQVGDFLEPTISRAMWRGSSIFHPLILLLLGDLSLGEYRYTKCMDMLDWLLVLLWNLHDNSPLFKVCVLERLRQNFLALANLIMLRFVICAPILWPSIHMSGRYCWRVFSCNLLTLEYVGDMHYQAIIRHEFGMSSYS